MNLYLGIEGGGTRTVAAVSDESGHILGRGEAGPANPVKVGLPQAKRALLLAARAALRAAQCTAITRRRPLAAVCLGLAGIGRPEMMRPIRAWIRRTLPARRHLLETDATIALYAAIGTESGILINSGTGSIALGRDEQGRTVRAGGWGSDFDDAGSGYDIGRKAIIAALRSFDGRGPGTKLEARLCRALKLPDIAALVTRPPTATLTASLFPLVADTARRGDPVARGILREAARELAELAHAVIRKCGPNLGPKRGPIQVAAAGGILRNNDMIYGWFRRELRERAPRARIFRLESEGVEGALRLAINIDADRPGGRKTR